MLLSCFSFHVFFYFGIRSKRCCLEMCWKGREFGVLGDWTTFPALSGRPGPPFCPSSENIWDKEEEVGGSWKEEVKPVRLKPNCSRSTDFYTSESNWLVLAKRGLQKRKFVPQFLFFQFSFFCDLFQDKFEGKLGKISARKVNWVVTVWYTLGTRYKIQSLRSGHKLAHMHTTLWAKVRGWRGEGSMRWPGFRVFFTVFDHDCAVSLHSSSLDEFSG